MNTPFASRVSLGTIAVLALCALTSHAAMAAEAASAVVAKEVVKRADAVGTKPATTGKVVVKAGAVIGKSDDNQYPSGSPIIPPKPKKEELEGAAIKANVAKP